MERVLYITQYEVSVHYFTVNEWFGWTHCKEVGNSYFHSHLQDDSIQ